MRRNDRYYKVQSQALGMGTKQGPGYVFHRQRRKVIIDISLIKTKENFGDFKIISEYKGMVQGI